MYREATLLLLIGHFLGDYYFQTDTIAQKENVKDLLWHCLIYTITMLILIIPVFSGTTILISLLISLTHFLIDYSKYQYKSGRELTHAQNLHLFLLDQLLHLTIISVANVIMVGNAVEISLIPLLNDLNQHFYLNINLNLSWILVILIVCKPASILVRKALNPFMPADKERNDTGIENAGSLIGIFERLIILFMLSANQFGAIGFVLTAKSVARYNKISEDSQFAEYYLLGTLLSSLIIIVSYYLIF